jgi:hypothetical protein
MIIDRARSFSTKAPPSVFQKTSARRDQSRSPPSVYQPAHPLQGVCYVLCAHSTAAVARPAARLALSLKRSRSRQTMLHLNASRGIPFFLLPAQLSLALRFNQLAVIFTFDLSG